MNGVAAVESEHTLGVSGRAGVGTSIDRPVEGVAGLVGLGGVETVVHLEVEMMYRVAAVNGVEVLGLHLVGGVDLSVDAPLEYVADNSVESVEDGMVDGEFEPAHRVAAFVVWDGVVEHGGEKEGSVDSRPDILVAASNTHSVGGRHEWRERNLDHVVGGVTF